MSHAMHSAESRQPSFTLQEEGGGHMLVLAGEWTALFLSCAEKPFTASAESLPPGVTVDMRGVSRLDTSGALFLNECLRGREPSYIYASEDQARLMEVAGGADISGAVPPPGIPAFLRLVQEIGKAIVEEGGTALHMIEFLGGYLVSCFGLLKSPGRLPVVSLVYHMQQVGVAAVPIVALLSFLIGIVIAYMGAQQLSMFGAEIFVVDLIAIITLRELAVLMTSIVIAGRSGSAFTAQIGAMKANEEVAAMRTLGLSPMLRLTFPRITALILMLPALVFLADVMGILGGGVAAWTTMNMDPEAFAARFQDVVRGKDFWVGLCKAPFFGLVIGVVGCYQGFQVTGSAESVGRLTTRSVVESIFMVILIDALFAMFFMGLGI